MTMEEIFNLSDKELYELSLAKNKKGQYTNEADMAYEVRRKRSGIIRYAGVPRKCNKYSGDQYYFGELDWQ